MSRRRSNVRQYSAEDQALTDISKEAENRLAVKRAVRTEAREIRMKEIERQEKEAEEKERLGSDYGSAKSRQQHSVASAASSRRGSDSSEGTNDSMSSNARNLKMELRTLEEKYKAAMMTSAQLDNERQSLVYQVELFKDQLEELTESQTELQREYKDKNRNLELTKRELQAAQLEVKGLREQNEHKDRLIAESGFVIVAAENGELSLERSDEPPSANGPIGTGGLLLSSESLVLLNKGREGSLGMHSLDSFNSAAHTTQAASGTGLAQPPSHTQAEESQSQSLVQASENVTTSGQNEEGSSVDGPVFQKSSKDRETGADSSLGKADQAETGVCAEAVEALSEQPGTAVSHSPDGKESKKSVPEAGGNMPVGNDDAGSVTSLPSEVVEDHISVLVTSHEGMGNESAEKSSDGMLTQLHGQESDCCKDKGRKVLDGAGVSEQNSAESPDTEGGDQIDSSSDASQSLTGSKSHSENSQSDLPSVVVTQCSHRSQDSEDDDVEFFDAVSTPLPSPRDAEFKYEETGADTQGQAAEAVSSEYSEVSGEDGKEVDGHVRGFGEDGKIGEEDGKEEVEEGGKEVEEGGKEVDGHDVREGAGEDGKVGEEDGKVVEEHDVREGLGEDGKIGEEDGKVVEEGGKEVDGHDVREGAGEDGKVGEEGGKEVDGHDVREGAGEDGKVGEEGGKEVEEHDVREGAGEDGKVGEEGGKEVEEHDVREGAGEDGKVGEEGGKEVDGHDVREGAGEDGKVGEEGGKEVEEDGKEVDGHDVREGAGEDGKIGEEDGKEVEEHDVREGAGEDGKVGEEGGKEVDGHDVREGAGEDGKVGEEDGKEVEEDGKEVDGHDVREGAGEDGKVGEEGGKEVDGHDVREGAGEDGKVGEEDGKEVEEDGKEVDGHDVREGAGEDGKVGEEGGKEVEEHDVREGLGEDGKIGEEDGKVVEEHDVREGLGEDGKIGEEGGKEVEEHDVREGAGEDGKIGEEDGKEVEEHDVREGLGEDGKIGEEDGKVVEEHDVREGLGEDGKIGEEDGKEVGGKEDKEADAEEDKDISEKDEKEVDGDDVKQVDEAADGQVVKEDIERVEGSEVTADNKILEVEGEGPHTDVEDSRSEGQEAHSEELERKANKSGTDDLTEMNESNQKPSESPSSDVKTCVGESAEQDDDSVGESMNVEKVSERVDGNVSVDACEAGGTGSEDNILQQTVGGASEEISEMLQHAQGTEQMPVGDTDAHTDDSGHVCREEINEKEEMEKALCDSKEDETSASPDEGHPAPSDNEPVDRQSSSQRETELDECHEESVSELDSVQARPLSEAETDDSVPTEPQNIKPSLEDGEDNDLKSKETGTDHRQTEPAHGEDTSKMEAEDIVKDHKEGSADKGGNEESEEVPDTLSPMLDSKPINREISEEGTSEDSEAQLGDDAYDFDDIDAVLDEGSPVTSKGKGGEQNVDGDSEDKVSFGSKDSGLQSESFTNKDSEASKEDTVSFGSRDSGLQENAPVKDRETGSGETVSMRSRDSGAGIEDMSSQDGSGGKSAAGAEVGAVGGASKPHSPVAGSRESLDLEAKLDKMVSQGSASKATPSKEKHGHKKSKFKMFKNIFK